MICFSDLDRTLICSKKLVDGNPDAICIEYKGDEEISYVNDEIVNNLKKLNKKMLFVPTTTRSLEQFDRIDFNRFGIEFKYSIVSNGAIILKNGKPMESWSNKVREIKENSTSMNVLLEEYHNVYSDTISSYIKMFRVVEDNFFYVVLNKDIDKIDFLEDFIRYIEDNNWVYFKNCSKVYFLPRGITKESAIGFLLKEELDEDEFIALGDSKMDEGMLRCAKKSYIPKHGDLASSFEHSDLYLTKETGLNAVNEILETLLLDN